MHVLIVDPDSNVATTVTTYLKTNKHTVTVVQTAAQAIVACDNKKPDVVLLELALGKHSGIEFVHEFKSYADWATIPIIAHTMQYIQDPSVLQHIGIALYLYKPKTSLQQIEDALHGNIA